MPELTKTSPYVRSITFTMANPMPDSNLAFGQSRLYPPVRDFGFGLRSHIYAVFLEDTPGASQEARKVAAIFYLQVSGSFQYLVDQRRPGKPLFL
jgi:hypothetical protein